MTRARRPAAAASTSAAPLAEGEAEADQSPVLVGEIVDADSPGSPSANPEEPVPSGALLRPLAYARPAEHPVAVYLAGLAPSSRREMRYALGRAAAILSREQRGLEDLPWSELRYGHLQALRAALVEHGFASTYTNRILSAVRGVLRAAWRLGQLDSDTLQHACDVKGVGGTRLPTGRDVGLRERQRLLEICQADPLPNRGARDAAALALLVGTGIRRAEAVGADLEHLDLDGRALRVRGKGNKERQVFLVDGSLRALEWWLSRRGSEAGPLLWPVLKGGHLRARRLAPQAIGRIVERRSLEAGLCRRTTPHDFRRTFTGDLLDAGADLAAAQSLLGHASPVTTARYDRRGERARRRANELVVVPFSAASTED